MERFKYGVESEQAAIDHAVQENPEYESFLVAGYTTGLGPGQPGFYTVLGFESEEDRLDCESILDSVDDDDFVFTNEVLE